MVGEEAAAGLDLALGLTGGLRDVVDDADEVLAETALHGSVAEYASQLLDEAVQARAQLLTVVKKEAGVGKGHPRLPVVRIDFAAGRVLALLAAILGGFNIIICFSPFFSSFFGLFQSIIRSIFGQFSEMAS